jgi:hypothetical protein
MITIYCTAQVRELWPQPLARRWLEEYPNIFDADDLRLTRFQPKSHFCEWFAAIHVFQSRGALSLVEKYRRAKAHPSKRAKFERLLSPKERRALNEICADHAVQPPDLLVYTPDFSERWFAEVKGPGDRLSEKQLKSHGALAGELKIPVDVIEVRIDGRRPPNLRMQPSATDRKSTIEPARRRG